MSSKAFRVRTDADEYGSPRIFIYFFKGIEDDLDSEYRSGYQSHQEENGQYKSSVTKNLMSLNKMKQEYTDLMNKESAYAKKDKKEIIFSKKTKP